MAYVDEEDAAKLVAGNKIMRCVAQCKKLHDGPLTAVEEINDMVKKLYLYGESIAFCFGSRNSIQKVHFHNSQSSEPTVQTIWTQHGTEGEKYLKFD